MSELEELRALVREVIRDVLPNGLAVTETVNLSTDEDLAAFVKRILDLDPGQREELRSGRKRFRLASPQALSVPAGAGQINGAERAGPSAPARRIERGAVTETVIAGGAGRGAARARPRCGAHPAGQGPRPGERRADREGALMLTATVIGSVWATRRLAELPNGAFLEVEADGTGQRMIAFDVLGSGVGERVLVTQGSVAAAWFAGKPPPVDALIIGSIDPDPEGE
jgi:ethanolamine utilization protein EutN